MVGFLSSLLHHAVGFLSHISPSVSGGSVAYHAAITVLHVT